MSPPEEPETDDDLLVGAAQEGDVRALERLLLRHEAKVLRVVRFLGVPDRDREDVAQEIFIRVFRHLRGFDRSKPFAGWIYRVTVNAAQDYRQHATRTGTQEAPLTEAVASHARAAGNPEEAAVEHALRRRLEASLEQLTDRERAVFVLRELEGLETKEIARALGVTSITVRRHLGQAKNRLQSLLRGEKKLPNR